TWACWGDTPYPIEAGVGVCVDTHTGLVFGSKPRQRRWQGEEVHREMVCFRVRVREERGGQGKREPVNLLLQTPAKREAQ
ncbi:hypothetical protein KIPB_013978, partial [Kipferlia bialata]